MNGYVPQHCNEFLKQNAYISKTKVPTYRCNSFAFTEEQLNEACTCVAVPDASSI